MYTELQSNKLHQYTNPEQLPKLGKWSMFPASYTVDQRFSNFFQVGTTFISQNVLQTTLLLGLSNSLGLP